MGLPVTPANIIARMRSQHSSGGITLIEIVTKGGVSLFISDEQITANSVLTGADAVEYMPWLLNAPSIHEYRSSQTSTMNDCEIQNISGNTISRDTATFFKANELTGALIFIRIWLADAEYALYSWLGKLDEPECSEESMTLTGYGFDNFSQLKAPPYSIGVTCGLNFASPECGSTSGTPCNQSYGTCSSIERFKGFVTQWNGAALTQIQTAQPAQSVQMNNTRSF